MPGAASSGIPRWTASSQTSTIATTSLASAGATFARATPSVLTTPAHTAFSDTDGPGLAAALATAIRRDDPAHRGRRAYADRQEARFTLPDPS